VLPPGDCIAGWHWQCWSAGRAECRLSLTVISITYVPPRPPDQSTAHSILAVLCKQAEVCYVVLWTALRCQLSRVMVPCCGSSGSTGDLELRDTCCRIELTTSCCSVQGFPCLLLCRLLLISVVAARALLTVSVISVCLNSCFFFFFFLILLFMRPIAQSRRLKINQLQMDMALTQIWMCS